MAYWCFEVLKTSSVFFASRATEGSGRSGGVGEGNASDFFLPFIHNFQSGGLVGGGCRVVKANPMS